MAHTAASSVVSIVLAIYRVSEGDYLNALVYGTVAVAGIIGVCRWWKVTYQVDYVGEKGIARFAGGKDTEETISNVTQNLDTNNIPSMTKQEIIDNISDNWRYIENNGFVHIKDSTGKIRIRIDPPDKVTRYPHVHVYDGKGNLLDRFGNIVDKKSPDGHIPYKN